MYCRNCGTDAGSSKYCPNCGAEQTGGAAAPPPNQPQYQTYNNNMYYAPPRNEPDMTVGDWMITLLISFIPLVGFICLIVWAASSPEHKGSRKNWAIANLIWTAIFFIASIVIVVILAAVGTNTTT